MKGFLAAGLLVVLALAFFVSPWASREPDGLERVAIDHGLTADDHALDDAPTTRLGTGVGGIVGVTVTLALTGGVLWVVRRRRA